MTEGVCWLSIYSLSLANARQLPRGGSVQTLVGDDALIVPLQSVQLTKMRADVGIRPYKVFISILISYYLDKLQFIYDL